MGKIYVSARRGKKSKSKSKSKSRSVSYQNPILRNKGPFPITLNTQLVYGETISLTSTAGSVAVQTYRLNSLFDTDLSGIGHQPRFFDTLCNADAGSAPYEQYVVKGAKYSVKFINTNSSGTSIGYVACRVRSGSSDALTVSDYQAMQELPMTQWKIIQTHDGAGNVQTLSGKIAIAKVLGCKDVLDNEELRLVYNASPATADSVFLDIMYYPIDGATSATIRAVPEIIFYTQFSEFNKVAQS